MTSRLASHAGSWYSDNGPALKAQLRGWLTQAELGEPHAPARAIISPHAGYSYCGACAAFAYRQINPSGVKRIFVLGPSHHFYLERCALTAHAAYKTPVGDLTIDRGIVGELASSGLFDVMSSTVDEEEHSIEMQLPYIATVMDGHNFGLVPILVGNLDAKAEATYGRLIRPYLQDPSNVFVISSDFCHWGSRFRYQHVDPSCEHIHEGIEKLDRLGMSLIERLAPADFHQYLKDFHNTICGRHPIAVLLHAVQGVEGADLKFLQYAQSSKCMKRSDSSVSYAAASLLVSNK